MKVYCCVCNLDKETGEIVEKDDQEYPASHGYCKNCLDLAKRHSFFCRICKSFHDGEYEDSRYCSWNCHLISLEEK